MPGSKKVISEQDLDRSNDAWRTTPLYQEAMAAMGVDPSRPIKLNEKQKEQLHQFVAQRGMVLPKGTEFDSSGNVNRDDRGFAETKLGKSLIIAGAIGASMFIPGVAPAVFGALGGGGGAAGGAAGAAGASGGGAGAAAGGGLLASSAIPTSLAMGAVPAGITSAGVSAGIPIAAGAAGAAGAGGVATGGGAMSRLLNRDTLGAAGRGLGAISQAHAQNRGEEFGGQMDLERLMMDRDAEHRASGRDAWGRLLSAQRTLNPGPRPQLSPYSVAPRQATDMERSGADAMASEVMARLQGSQRPLSVDPRLLKPGTGERVSGYLSPLLSGASSYFGGR